jgi:hypothetical protein
MATSLIDFSEVQQQEEQQEQTEVSKDSPTEGELTSMTGIGTLLKTYHDAEEAFDKAKTCFSAQFDEHTASQIAAFRDAYWIPKSNETVCIKGVEMTWNDFVENYFGVTRRWLNKVLKRYLAPAGTSDDDDDTSAKSELLTYVKRLDEDEASSLLGQITDDFNGDDEPDEEEDEEVQQVVTPDGEERLTEKEKVLTYAKRISGGRAEMLKLFFEEIAAKLGLDDRLVITVE